MKRQLTAQQALIKLEDLCAKAEHCSYEIHEKLKRWGICIEDANKIVAILQQKKFIDDYRFAIAYVNDKLKFAHWGRRKIHQGLYIKRIDNDIISKTLDEIDQKEYFTILVDIMLGKLRSVPDLIDSYEGRTKLYRFALQRGFDTSDITRAMKNIIKENS